MFEDLIDERKAAKNFYRNRYRNFSEALFYMLCLIFAELLLLLAIYFFQAEPTYYASNSDGEITRITPTYRGASLPKVLPSNTSTQQPKG